MKVKICCISTIAEGHRALAAGADHLGLVGPMPSGPGKLAISDIQRITAGLADKVDTWLLTSKTTSAAIISEFEQSGARSLQLTDALQDGEADKLRNHLRGVRIVQVIHVVDEKSQEEALAAEQWFDAVLLDSGNPSLKIKQLGGTGKTHDWAISRKIVEQAAVPIYLAGGLSAANVSVAIERVQPAGVDLCSGVRSGGCLDLELLHQFMQCVRR